VTVKVESKGHLYWIKVMRNPECVEMIEYYERDGDVFRAPMSCVVMPDGYRVGRFECPARMWNQLFAILKSSHEIGR
jgi:hypothetical protein